MGTYFGFVGAKCRVLVLCVVLGALSGLAIVLLRKGESFTLVNCDKAVCVLCLSPMLGFGL